MPEPISVIALLVATGALYCALRPRTQPATATEKAFKRLESDVEGLFEKVESHLGRISRLKRGTTLPGGAPAQPVNSPAVPERLSRAGLLAKSRRQYAESNRYGAGKERRQ